MEAKLRYRKELQSGGVGANLGIKSQPKKKPANHKKDQPAPQSDKIGSQATTKVSSPKSESPESTQRSAEPRLDFIQRNIDGASNQKSRAHPPKKMTYKESIVDARHAPGEIPKSITNRKEEISREHQPPPEAKCPRGMRMMTDEEKNDAIAGLTERKEEIEATLGHAPLRIESPQLIRQKRILEQELGDIESSLAQLKKKFVFVPDD